MIDFKNIQQEVEFEELTEPRLYGMVLALVRFVENEFGKDLILTDVARMNSSGPHGIREEQPECRAVDIRCHFEYFTEEELWAMKEFLKTHFPRSDMEALEASIAGWYGTLRHHGSGAKEHIHVCVEPLSAFRKALLT